MAYIALAIALIAVSAFITIPATVPFTLQIFAIFFTLEYLGGGLSNGIQDNSQFIIHNSQSTDTVYDFSGRRSSLKKGAYIVNGQKVVVK